MEGPELIIKLVDDNPRATATIRKVGAVQDRTPNLREAIIIGRRDRQQVGQVRRKIERICVPSSYKPFWLPMARLRSTRPRPVRRSSSVSSVAQKCLNMPQQKVDKLRHHLSTVRLITCGEIVKYLSFMRETVMGPPVSKNW